MLKWPIIGKSEREISNIFKNNIIPVINSLGEIKNILHIYQKN